MTFDEMIDRRGTHCSKWDMMEPLYGVSPEDGIAMWVADMDFRPPACVTGALAAMVDHGIYGYFGDEAAYLDAVQWWSGERHGWTPEREAIFTTHGLVNGTGMCIDAFTRPGDGVVLLTPVYHAFARTIRAAEREVVECELARDAEGIYQLDIAAWDAQMAGTETMLILCSPHNPGGRVWTPAELREIADFAIRHDLILVSDEIHQDLLMPGHTHTPMVKVDGISDRLVMMTATTKTFNIAGAHIGNVIVPDPDLRARFAKRMSGVGISPNSFGLHMVTAAYSPEGAAWVDDLCAYLDGNRRLFDAGINAIPGLRSMPLEGTYLAWVDFTGAGMDQAEALRRVQDEARIVVNHGTTFGKGGESFLRFNLATPRARVEEAVTRMQAAFADLQ